MPPDLITCVPCPTPSGLGPSFFNIDNMLVPQNLALIVVAWSLTELVSRSARGLEFVQQRLLPVLPVVFCTLFVFATASWQPQATPGERLLLGALLGTATVWGHIVAKKVGIHDKLPFMRRTEGLTPAGPGDGDDVTGLSGQKNTGPSKKDA